MKTLAQYLQEATEPEKLSVTIGRFQPFHLGHSKMIELMKYKPLIFLVKGKGTSEDKKSNPFDETYQQYLIQKVFPGIEVRVVNNANLSPVIYHTEKTGERKVAEIMAGADRIPSYQKRLKDRSDIQFTETPRVTSATKVREAILSDDLKTFKQLMPRQLWGEWETMKGKMVQ